MTVPHPVHLGVLAEIGRLIAEVRRPGGPRMRDYVIELEDGVQIVVLIQRREP